MPRDKSRKNLVLEIWGEKGVENGGFGIFSKTSVTIWFHLLVKEDIIILDICAKSEVQAIFRTLDIGLNDLTILRPFDRSILKVKVNDACAAMIKEYESRDLCKDL